MPQSGARPDKCFYLGLQPHSYQACSRPAFTSTLAGDLPLAAPTRVSVNPPGLAFGSRSLRAYAAESTPPAAHTHLHLVGAPTLPFARPPVLAATRSLIGTPGRPRSPHPRIRARHHSHPRSHPSAPALASFLTCALSHPHPHSQPSAPTLSAIRTRTTLSGCFIVYFGSISIGQGDPGQLRTAGL